MVQCAVMTLLYTVSRTLYETNPTEWFWDFKGRPRYVNFTSGTLGLAQYYYLFLSAIGILLLPLFLIAVCYEYRSGEYDDTDSEDGDGLRRGLIQER